MKKSKSSCNVIEDAKEIISQMEKVRDKFQKTLTVEEKIKVQSMRLKKVRDILIQLRSDTRIELDNKNMQITELQKQLDQIMSENARLRTENMRLADQNKDLLEELDFEKFTIE